MSAVLSRVEIKKQKVKRPRQCAEKLIGVRFNRLVVTSAARAGNGKMYCEVLCDCGNTRTVHAPNLRNGNTNSCGCYALDRIKATSTKHGHATRRSPEYRSWLQMRKRCTDAKADNFPYYGGNGIKVCDRWGNFIDFLADMGEKPTPQHTIDRIDNNGDYEPGNCRWATMRQQWDNRRQNAVLKYKGRQMTVTQWATEIGVRPGTLFARISYGWPVDEILGRKLRYQKKPLRSPASE